MLAHTRTRHTSSTKRKSTQANTIIEVFKQKDTVTIHFVDETMNYQVKKIPINIFEHALNAFMRRFVAKKNDDKFSDESWDDIFQESRSRVGGIREYQKAAAMIRGFRLREGWTQLELAKKLNTQQSNISAMERAAKPIGKRFAKKLAEVFDTSQSIFLTELPQS